MNQIITRNTFPYLSPFWPCQHKTRCISW